MLRRLLPWVGVVAVLVAVTATAGWHNEPAATPKRSTPATPSPAAPTSLSVAETSSVVRTSGLRRSDLPRGFRRVPRQQGLAGPRLKLCGSSFDSEPFRLAAHRVAFEAPGNRGRVSGVVVAYKPGHVEQALAELDGAAARCARPVKPTAEEQPDLLAMRLRVTGDAGVPRHDLVVERCGDVLSLLWVDQRQGGLTLPLARRLGNRLESRQPSV